MNNKKMSVQKAMSIDNYQLIDGMLTVAEAIKLAKKHNIEALIINKRHDNDEYGLVMLSDIAKEVIAKDCSPERVNVYEIMTKPALTVKPTMDVKYCARLFERLGIHIAPVMENEKILGMVDYTQMVFSQLDN